MSSSISSSDASRFLRQLVACLLVGSSLVVSWNYVIDPYDMWHGRTRHGFNHFKVRTESSFDRMAKAQEIRRLKPEVLILGTSRADWGIDPNHPGLRAESARSYNASLSGGTIYELYRYLQHAQYHHRLRTVVLGLDLELFNLLETRDSFDEDRLAVHPDMRFNPRSLLADRLETLFTLDALKASHKTIRASRDHLDVTREELVQRGSRFWEDLAPDTAWKMYRGGVHQARDNLGQLKNQEALIRQRLEYYDRVLDFCHQHDIRLVLYITPYHLSHLEVLRISQNWVAFEAWKRELVVRNQRIAEAAGRAPFPLWDFSGYHRYATEAHPSPEDPYRVMTWYRESSHFRKRTGDMILDRVLNRPSAPADFGVRLDPGILDQHLAGQRQQRDAFLAARAQPAVPAP